MTSQADLVPPPHVADWLVNLFSPAEGAETILGDLLEEYSQLASKSGTAVARSWYRRQSVKTIAHLFGAGFRNAPWSTAVAIVGGLLLHGFVSGLPGKLLSALTDKYLFYWSAHFKAYMFFATDGMLIAHLILSVFVGCIVALVARGREMVATVTLALVLCSMSGVAYLVSARDWLTAEVLLWMLWQCVGPFALVVGGAIVRTRRSAVTISPSQA
jgi:Fe2+ transport system protein B